MTKNRNKVFTHAVIDSKSLQIAILLITVLFAILLSRRIDLTEAQIFIENHRPHAAIISILIYILIGFTVIPTIPLTLFLAVLLTPLQAAILATIGNTLAALIHYKIGQTMGDVLDFKEKKSRLPFGLGNLPLSSPLLLIACRYIPFGKRGFSYVCGAYQVIFSRYLWTTLLVYGVDSFILAYCGASLSQLIFK